VRKNITWGRTFERDRLRVYLGEERTKEISAHTILLQLMPPCCLPQEVIETKGSLPPGGLAHFGVQFTQLRRNLSHPAHAAHSVVALESF
jgi:hypothetical protein